MPVKKSAAKAIRQDKKRTERNRMVKLKIGDARRAVRKAIEAGDSKKAGEAAATTVKLLDKAYSKGVMKLNTVSRYKSRLLAKVSALQGKK